jgi:hypothetical protein
VHLNFYFFNDTLSTALRILIQCRMRGWLWMMNWEVCEVSYRGLFYLRNCLVESRDPTITWITTKALRARNEAGASRMGSRTWYGWRARKLRSVLGNGNLFSASVNHPTLHGVISCQFNGAMQIIYFTWQKITNDNMLMNVMGRRYDSLYVVSAHCKAHVVTGQ